MNTNLIQITGIVAGILTSISMLPQLLKVIREKEVEDISAGMLALLIAGLSTWVVYGILKKDIPIIATNGLSVLLNLLMLYCKWRFGEKK